MAVEINCLEQNPTNCVPCIKEQSPDYKPNVTCEECTPLQPQICTIDTAVCIPIIGERIYDCICIQKEQNSYLPEVTFTIVGSGTYPDNAPICIQEKAVTYSFIGLENIEGNRDVIIDGTSYPFSPILLGGCENTSLFRGLEQTLSFENRCCCLPSKPASSLARIIEKNKEFYVCDFQVRVKGYIGNVAFEAYSNVLPGKLNSINELDFTDVTFIGQLCLPTGPSQNVVIRENFDSCIKAEKISPLSKVVTVGTDKTFLATLELSFKVRKEICATIKQNLAVFSTSYPIKYNDRGVLSSCTNDCPK